MYSRILAAAPNFTQPGIPIPHGVAVAILALLASATILVVLKVIAKILTPKKKNPRPASSPYGSTRR